MTTTSVNEGSGGHVTTPSELFFLLAVMPFRVTWSERHALRYSRPVQWITGIAIALVGLFLASVYMAVAGDPLWLVLFVVGYIGICLIPVGFVSLMNTASRSD